MGKRPKFGTDQMLSAALDLLVDGGPQRVSMAGVARAIGAPSGSVYHRFPSRDHLLAELWVRTVNDFQQAFARSLQSYTVEDALGAVQSALDWTRANPARAQLLLLYRRRDIVSGPWPEELRSQALSQAQQLDAILGRLAQELDLDLERVVFAVSEVFLAGVRPSLSRGEPIPRSRDLLVLEAARALLRS